MKLLLNLITEFNKVYLDSGENGEDNSTIHNEMNDDNKRISSDDSIEEVDDPLLIEEQTP